MEPRTRRRNADEIYDQVFANGRSELNRSTGALAFSGLAAGLLMGLTGLGVAGTRAVLPGRGGEFISLLFYPLGFIAVIIGRAQLFTENTLFPVVLVLSERRHVLVTLRLWVVVFVGNLVGALTFASLVTKTSALRPMVVDGLVHLGTKATAEPLLAVFASAIVGGWLVAMAAWMVSGSQGTIGEIASVWLMTFVVGLLGLAHCIASSGYVLVAALSGHVSAGWYVAWLAAATGGNIIGGVVIVALLNHWQVSIGGKGARLQRLQLAQNETLFRQANEDLVQRRSAADADDLREFICECANSECSERILMSLPDYRRIRDNRRWFAIIDGHQTPQIEPIVERHDGYVVVELTGEPGQLASGHR